MPFQLLLGQMRLMDPSVVMKVYDMHKEVFFVVFAEAIVVLVIIIIIIYNNIIIERKFKQPVWRISLVSCLKFSEEEKVPW